MPTQHAVRLFVLQIFRCDRVAPRRHRIAYDNAFDAALAALPEKQKLLLDRRYSSLTTKPRDLRFIDRLVADSRAVALNHTAGLSVPQQLQMALFALNGLMDRKHRYKDAAKQLIRQRYQTLYIHMGVKAARQPDDVNYYSLIDLQEIGGSLYGPEFKAWFIKSNLGISFLFRLAKETGVVLLPGKGLKLSIPQRAFRSPTLPISNTRRSESLRGSFSMSAIKTSKRLRPKDNNYAAASLHNASENASKH